MIADKWPAASFLLSVALAMTGCGSVYVYDAIHPKLEFVLPNSLRGSFAVVYSPNGKEVRKIKGIYVLGIEGLVTEIRNPEILDRMTQRSARFEDGSKLAAMVSGKGNTALSLFSGGYQSSMGVRPHYSFFVGSGDEFEKRPTTPKELMDVLRSP